MFDNGAMLLFGVASIAGLGIGLGGRGGRVAARTTGSGVDEKGFTPYVSSQAAAAFVDHDWIDFRRRDDDVASMGAMVSMPRWKSTYKVCASRGQRALSSK